MKSSELNQRRQQATPRGVGVMCNYFVEKAENATLWDIEGNEVIDFAAGIAVLNTGHRHPKVVAAVAEQLQAFTHTAYQIVPYESYVSLAERINDLAPIDGPAKTAFFTTGAEAVENAVKIARAYTGRPGLITFGGGFHGRTFMTMALTGKVAPYKIGFGPFPGSVYHGVYPNAAHGVTTADALKSLERIFKADIAPDQVAAIILEPIQGEGGFNVAPADFMQALRDLCDTHGILLIADEVQTGFARTGKLFACEHAGITADILCLGKALTGGTMTLSAAITTRTVAETISNGEAGCFMHGPTFMGNPLACAVASESLRLLESGEWQPQVAAIEAQLQAELATARGSALVADVRVLGAIGVVETRRPVNMAALQRFFVEQGVWIRPFGRLIYLMPPYIITPEQLTRLTRAVNQAVQDETFFSE